MYFASKQTGSRSLLWTKNPENRNSLHSLYHLRAQTETFQPSALGNNDASLGDTALPLKYTVEPFHSPQAKHLTLHPSLSTGEKSMIQKENLRSVKEWGFLHLAPVHPACTAQSQSSRNACPAWPTRRVLGPWSPGCALERPHLRDSEYLRFSSCPCLLLQLLFGTFREGEKRECSY